MNYGEAGVFGAVSGGFVSQGAAMMPSTRANTLASALVRVAEGVGSLGSTAAWAEKVADKLSGGSSAMGQASAPSSPRLPGLVCEVDAVASALGQEIERLNAALSRIENALGS